MVTVDVHEAETHLPRLLERVEAGEEVIIARDGRPVARLIPYALSGRQQFGSWKDRIAVDDSFFDPLPDEELAAWEA
ncbi:MAG: type II toxin-antitoxin system prevent-host-death family antitoxin [bacterium]|nr:type II toxin-antitoxin system prevent-host-death family antitoxin [bacterium]MDE0353726.1 type II toxin-antitoxin system prevent-host-death family antitoxin [bacterium]